ncbi:ABC transporter type 1, transmembrane domain-containing protein, partial [Endogone sp. FLAS-F59071]
MDSSIKEPWICENWVNGTLHDVTPCFREIVLDSALPLSFVAFSILSYLFGFIIHRISHQPAYQPLTDQDDAERTVISSLPFYEDTIKQLDYPAVKRRISRSEVAVFVFSAMQVVLWAVLTVWRVRGGHKDHNNEQGWPRLVGSVGALIAWSYPTLLSLLALRHIIPTPKVYPFLCNFYAATVIAAVVGMRSLLHETAPEDRLHVDFLLSGVVNLVLTWILLVVSFTIPKELDWTLTQESGIGFSSKNHPASAESIASPFSSLSFSWIDGLINLGNVKTLTSDDLWELIPADRAVNLYHRFRASRRSRDKPSLLWRIFVVNGIDIIRQSSYSFVYMLLDFANPLLLSGLLTFMQSPEKRRDPEQRELAYLYVVGMMIVALWRTVYASQMFLYARGLELKIRAMLDSEIYNKSLKRRDMTGMVQKKENNEEEDADKFKNGASEANGKAKDDKKDKKKKDDKDDGADAGKITNLMAVDAHRVAGLFGFLYFIYNSPISIVIGTYFLYQLLGWSCFVGMSVMLVTMPLNQLTQKSYDKFQEQLMSARDKRVSLMNELLQGIRMIKFFAWSRNFRARVLEARELEMKRLISLFIVNACFTLLWFGSPILVTVLTFISFVKFQHGELTAAVAFTSIALFDRLRLPLNALPEILMELVTANVSLRRIEKFLREREIMDSVHDGIDNEGRVIEIGFKDATFQWHSASAEAADKKNKDQAPQALVVDETTFVLRDLNVNFPVGEMTLVCGATGSGKTSLLMALLGEMDLIEGQVYLPRTTSGEAKLVDPNTGLIMNGVAFVAQSAWLQHATIRENILFGQPYDEKRYKKVLHVCGLERDLDIFEDGDSTEIGEKGITLSGGQKQRVSLARAVYSRARHVLLDDCLSAVDSHTARHIYEKCLMGSLMKGRTRILVTHHVRLCLPGADFVTKVDHGKIVLQKRVSEVFSNRSLLTEILEEGDNIDEDFKIRQTEEEEEDATEDIIENILDPENSEPSQSTSVQTQESVTGPTKADKKAHKLIQEEQREQGQVKMKIYGIYFGASGGIFYWAIVIATFLIVRVSVVSEGWWIKIWSSAYSAPLAENFTMSVVSAQDTYTLFQLSEKSMNQIVVPAFAAISSNFGNMFTFTSNNDSNTTPSPPPHKEVNVNFYLTVYVIITISSILAQVLRMSVQYFGSLKASRILYVKLLDAVINAPLRFFDTTPVGRIINRFSKDFETIDSRLSSTCGGLLMYILAVSAVVTVISIITPAFLLAALPIVLVYLYVGRRYIRCSRELKRLDSVTKSPLYSHFGETLVGVATIRAFGEESRFLDEIFKRIDDNNRTFYLTWMCNRWLSTRADSIGAVVAFLAGIFLLLNLKNMDAGLVGLSLTYALQFVFQVNWIVRQYTQVEMDLNAVERVQEYLVMPQEPPAIIENHRPPAAWPTAGQIDVKDLVIQYAPELEQVIRGITFDVRP